jgi:hypothetical protein
MSVQREANTPTATIERPTEAHTAGAPPRRRWQPVHYWALLGLALGLYVAWMLVAWVADGPTQVTEFRDHSDVSWWAARGLEAVAILVALGMSIYLVRDCIKNRQLTLITRICIACLATMVFDSFINFYQPIWFYSSQLVNLSAPCGHAPGVVNPDCGALPWPIIFGPLMYGFGLPLGALLISAALRRLRARRPNISTIQLILLALAVGFLLDIAVDGGLMQFHLWAHPGFPDWFSIGGNSPYRYSFVLMIADGLIFLMPGLLLFFRDDRGQTFVERGLDQVRPGARSGLSLLAHIGILGSTVLVAAGICAVWGAYSSPYPHFPPHLINKLCDGAGSARTAYGPCPGSDGYRMPIRHN